MKLEDLVVGAYVNWVADRYMKSWDIMGKIVKIEEDGEYEGKPYHRVTILGFDDMKENTVGHTTVMDECTIVSQMMALNYYDQRILSKEQAILNARYKLDQLITEKESMVGDRSKM